VVDLVSQAEETAVAAGHRRHRRRQGRRCLVVWHDPEGACAEAPVLDLFGEQLRQVFGDDGNQDASFPVFDRTKER
jgi:hypothetical protein